MRVSTTEADVLAACLQYLALRGVCCWRSNNGAVYDPTRKCYRAFRGAKGMADILGIIPRTNTVDGVPVTHGVFLAIEVKRPGGGKLSAEQEHFLGEIERLGGIALCVRSVTELQSQLEPYLAGPRRVQIVG